jgi:dihydroxyacetone kinase-like protein
VNTAQLVTATRAALERLAGHADELGDLDQALGDGDLGITISSGADAVSSALEDVPADARPADVLRVAAKAFASANPSTMAALVAGALLAGARAWGDATEVGRAEGAALAAALVPAADALRDAPGTAGAVDAAVAAAAQGVEQTTQLQSQKGRAAWLQERSRGLPDGGAVAMLRFLESWRDATSRS